MSITYNFTKASGGATVATSDGLFKKNYPTPPISIDVNYAADQVYLIFPEQALPITRATVGTINGVQFSGTLDQLADTLLNSVFPKAASGIASLTAVPDTAIAGVTYTVTIKNGSWDFQINP